MRIKGRKLRIDKTHDNDKNFNIGSHKLGHQRLQAKSGLGYIELKDDGSPSLIADLHADNTRTVFVESNEELMP
jgi:hypothetical protein